MFRAAVISLSTIGSSRMGTNDVTGGLYVLLTLNSIKLVYEVPVDHCMHIILQSVLQYMLLSTKNVVWLKFPNVIIWPSLREVFQIGKRHCSGSLSMKNVKCTEKP